MDKSQRTESISASVESNSQSRDSYYGEAESDQLPDVSDLKAAYIQDGHAYLLVGQNSSPWCIEVDGAILMPKPTQSPRLNLFDQDLDLTFDSLVDNESFECSSSQHQEFTVSGEKAYVIRIKDRASRLVVPVISSHSFPAKLVGNRSAIVLATGFRNCEAIVRVEISSADGQILSEASFISDSAYKGGSLPSNFKALEHKVPRPLDRDQLMTVTVEVTYVSALNPDDSDPFIIISSPRLVQCLGRSDRPAARSLLNSDVDISHSLGNDCWLKTKLPALTTHTALRVKVLPGPGLTAVVDQLIPRTPLKLISEYGHVIQCSAPIGSQYLLRINGEPVKRVSFIGTREQWISIPTQFLGGHYVLLDFQDISGTLSSYQLWLKTPQILTDLQLLQETVPPPYPDNLTAAQAYRYRSLTQRLNSGDDESLENHELSVLLNILECGPVTRKSYPPIRIPTSTNPVASIIIPCHNKFSHTYCCLAAVAFAATRIPYEVILVDDGSEDETLQAEEIFHNITVVHNPIAQRFIRACTAGSLQAKGDYLVLLNNDTEVTVGWLDKLVDAFTRFKSVGIAGSKLLYPDGTLQEAGGIVWNTGNPWNYGKNMSAHDPRFRYARQADYLSGAALMISREAWDSVGGLSSYLEPMYFEDTDICFKVREAGFSTWYIPSSTVFHYEGATSGTDVTEGFKAFQEINRPKFKRKWSKAFRSLGTEGERPDIVKDRNISFRVLFVDYQVSMPDKDAGSMAAINEIKLLQSFGAKVTFLPTNLGHFGSYVDELERDGVEVITAPFFLSLETFFLERAAEFDLFYVNRYNVATEVIRFIRRSNPTSKIILNLTDLHYLRLLRKAAADGSAELREQAMEIKRVEVEMMENADLVLSYSSHELAAIESSTNCKASTALCPWFVDLPEHVPSREHRQGIAFLGSYAHHPNIEGILWFDEQVMPLLQSRVDTSGLLHLYGSRMTKSIQELASDSVLTHGYVEKISTVYTQHMVFLAPLLSGAGIKGKVINALAYGIPSVLSPYAAEGIGLRDGHDCIIASTPEQWADAIATLLQDPVLWMTISTNSRAYARASFSYDLARRRMGEILESVEIFIDS